MEKCSLRKFCYKFFTQISEPFTCISRVSLSWSSDLGITGKMFSSCRTWVYIHVWCQFGQSWWCQKWNKAQHSSWLVMAGTGVNGLILLFKFIPVMISGGGTSIIHRVTSVCYHCSIKGKRVITFEGERTVQDIIQFAEKASRYVNIVTCNQKLFFQYWLQT